MTDTFPMAGKVVLVTGGIGKATAIGLATMGARVGITGRDLPRIEPAAADIRAASRNQSVDVDGLTGQFFANRKPRTANEDASDRDTTARLWRVSADLVGMPVAAMG